MHYFRSFIATIAVGLLLFAGCGNSDQKKKDASGNQANLPGKVADKITTQRLLGASLEGDIAVAKKAVEQGVDIDIQDQSGRTPLMLAAYNGHSDMIRYLLEKGADLSESDNQGRTPLIFASSGPYPETVKLLLENDADPNKTDKAEGWSALMWAAAEGNEQVVRVLLEHGADPTLRDKDDETARDFATDNGHAKVAELLKQAENDH